MDSKIIEVCRREKRVLITLDVDFADVRAYPPKDYSGIIVFRIPNHSKKTLLLLLNEILGLLGKETLDGRLRIVEHGRVRIRGDEEI